MISTLKHFEDVNLETVTQFFNDDIENFNNVDSVLLDKIDIKTNDVNLENSEKKILFNHFSVTRTIAQISLNLFRNKTYFKDLKFDCKIILTAIEDVDDRNKYEDSLKQLQDIDTISEKIVLSNLTIFLIVKKLLKTKEGIMDSFRSDHSIPKVVSDSDQIGESGAYQIRSEFPTSISHTWKCFFCDNENDDESMMCSVCDTAKNEMTSGSSNEQGGKTGTSPCRPESYTVVDKFNVSRQWDGRTINRSNSSDISMELCPRCKIRSADKVKCMICGFCGNELYMKEMKELDVLAISNRVKNRQDTSVGRHVDEKMECEKSSDDHCGMKIVHNGGHSNIAGNVRYVLLSEDNAMAERSNQTREMESGMPALSICGASEQGIDYDGVTLGLHEWSCPKCTMKNPVSNDKCTTCDIIGPNTNEWQCSDCKKVHSYDVDKCGDCGGLGPHYDKWRCDQCTKINDKLARHCDDCSRNNMFINTCRRCHRNDVNVKYNELCDECLSGERKLEGTDHARVTTSVTINIGDKSQTNSDNDGPGEDKWRCTACSMINSLDVDKCVACGVEGPHFNKWICYHCKEGNSYDVDKCGDCGGHGPHYDKWRCDQCTKINDKLARLCDVCDAENNGIMKCPQCHVTDINSKYDTWCRECRYGLSGGNRSGEGKEDMGDGSDIPREDEWSCGKCARHNPYNLVMCGECATIGPHYDKWRCDKCTKINDKLARRCEACDAENNGIMKCPQCHVTDINSKYDTRCRECTYGLSGGNRSGEGKQDMGDGSDIPREDGWSCGKCARYNPYDLVMCGGGCGTMGPHYDKWRCDKCTKINDKLARLCDVCDAENNGIMKCPQCHVTDINSKYDTWCRECRYGLSGGNRRDEVKVNMGDGSDIPREDRWSCGKCARHNPYDLVMCGGCGTMGPHYDKWKCDKCTCLNNRWTSECSACHKYQQHRHLYALATIGGGESVHDECRGKCAERGDTLCYLCIGRYYKCDNTKCKKINSNDDKFCRHCGVKRGSLLYNDNLVECRIDGGIRKMWQCTFTKCMHLNSENCDVCTKCHCPRYTSYYYRCILCERMYSHPGRCTKCHCPRYTSNYHRCTHCGWMYTYPGRCIMCYPVTSL